MYPASVDGSDSLDRIWATATMSWMIYPSTNYLFSMRHNDLTNELTIEERQNSHVNVRLQQR